MPVLNIFALLVFLASMIMSIAGFFVFTRMLSTMINKSGYLYALKLIRRFFTDNNPEILPYLYLPVSPNRSVHRGGALISKSTAGI